MATRLARPGVSPLLLTRCHGMHNTTEGCCSDCLAKDARITELQKQVAGLLAQREARHVSIRKALSILMEGGEDISGFLENMEKGGTDLGEALFPSSP